jgi:hypothetical protein
MSIEQLAPNGGEETSLPRLPRIMRDVDDDAARIA